MEPVAVTVNSPNGKVFTPVDSAALDEIIKLLVITKDGKKSLRKTALKPAQRETVNGARAAYIFKMLEFNSGKNDNLGGPIMASEFVANDPFKEQIEEVIVGLSEVFKVPLKNPNWQAEMKSA